MTIHEYFYAKSLSDAIEQLTKPQKKSQIIAGGALIASQLRSGYLDCEQLVDISGISELKTEGKISLDGKNYYKLGAGLSLTRVEKVAIIAEKYPLLWQALHGSSDPARRNAYTLGGSIAARLPKGMLFPALCALKTKLIFLMKDSQRIIPLVDWFTLPMEEEIGVITAILIPEQKVIQWEMKEVKRRNHTGEVVVGALVALTQVEGSRDGLLQIFGSVDMYGLVDFSDIALSLNGESFTSDVLEKVESVMKNKLQDKWGTEAEAAYRTRALVTLVQRCLKELNGIAGVDK